MRAAVFSFTKRGVELSREIGAFFTGIGYEAVLWTMPKYAGEDVLGYPADYHDTVTEAMETCQAVVFVGATGICVRAIAPCLRDKTLDPAVISVDERANFVIPLISGHIGGANELARHLAEYIGATACVTTATDVNRLFAVDEWAVRNNLLLGNIKAAKAVAVALVNGEQVGFVKDDFLDVRGELPQQVVLGTGFDVGMAVSVYENTAPFATTLQIFPKLVHLGIGCRRDTPLENIESLVLMSLENLHIDMRSIAGIASVDLKKDEQGLLAFAEKYSLPIKFYTAEELNAAEGDFTPSEFVQSIVGVSNVCERSAVVDSRGGELLLRKTSLNGVTVAIAVKRMVLDFSKTGLRYN